MAIEMTEILAAADKLGTLVSQHPALNKYKDAQKAVGADPEASKLMTDFGQVLDTLSRQEQSGMPMTEAQRQQIETLQTRISSNLRIKALNIAEVDFTDMLRKVSQAWQKHLASQTGAAGAAASPLRM